MTVDGRKEALGHILVLIRIVLDLVDFLDFCLSETWNDLLPDSLLVELLARFILSAIGLLFFFVKLVKLIVFNIDVYSHEDEFVAEVAHALDAGDSALCVCYSAGLITTSGQLSLLSGLEHAGQFG